ncbi:MAG: YHS domain-containing protein [Acidobacteriota bacterium]
MSGLLSLLLFGAFFYFMMRFGCGAHMVHGHGGHEGHAGHGPGTGANMEGMMTKDPVCGMEVQPGEGYAKMHQGRQYRFCSRKCLDQFEAEPQRYAQVKGGM